MYIGGLWIEVFELASEQSAFLSKGELLQSRNMVGTCLSEPKYSVATATHSLPGFFRVPNCGVVGHSSLELGSFV